MTEIQKVSIGGYGFTLEVEAYNLVKKYLDELEAWYAKLEGGAEVMEGFEERMAELLYERCGDSGVASVADVQRIMDILGKPEAIETDEDAQPAAAPSATKSEKPKEHRRLYRIPTGKMLGGVCNGLAAYFKIDVVWLRIAFVVLVILGMTLSRYGSFFDNLAIWACLLYMALWIAMPEAKTVQQRWEMGVSNPPAAPPQAPHGTTAGRIALIVIGSILLLMGVAGLTMGLAAVSGFRICGTTFMEGLRDMMSWNAPELLPVIDSWWAKLLGLLVWMLPCLGTIYGGVMLIFDLRPPRWRPGLVIFCLWIISVTVMAVLTTMTAVGS